MLQNLHFVWAMNFYWLILLKSPRELALFGRFVVLLMWSLLDVKNNVTVDLYPYSPLVTRKTWLCFYRLIFNLVRCYLCCVQNYEYVCVCMSLFDGMKCILAQKCFFYPHGKARFSFLKPQTYCNFFSNLIERAKYAWR